MPGSGILFADGKGSDVLRVRLVAVSRNISIHKHGPAGFKANGSRKVTRSVSEANDCAPGPR